MIRLTQQEQNIFFSILRAALWQKPIDTDIPNDINWKVIYDALEKHALLAIVADVLMKAPGFLCTPLVAPLMEHCARTTQTHYKLNGEIRNVFTLLEREGITPILLKGQGLAQLYPIKNTRTCGDIDFYVFPEDFEKAKKILEDYCGYSEVEKAHDTKLHYEISRNGITFELHHIAFYPTISKHLKYAISYSETVLRQQELETTLLPLPDNKFYSATIPPKDYNIYFIFDHMCRHIKREGVAFKQLIDWMMLLNAEKASLSSSKLDWYIKKFGTYKAWVLLGNIAVDKFGYSPTDFPFYQKRSEKNTRFLLDLFMSKGSFSHVHANNPKPKEFGCRRWMYVIISLLKRAHYSFELFPSETVIIIKEILLLPYNSIRYRQHHFNTHN